MAPARGKADAEKHRAILGEMAEAWSRSATKPGKKVRRKPAVSQIPIEVHYRSLAPARRRDVLARR